MSEDGIRCQVARLFNYFVQKGYCNTTGGGITFLSEGDKLYYVPSDCALRCNGMGKRREHLSNQLIKKVPLLESNYPDICAPLIVFPFINLDAEVLIHSHSTNSIICSLMDHCKIPAKFQMSKHIYNLREKRFLREYEEVNVPIIDEIEMNDEFSRSCAFLVRGHGLFLWSTSHKDAVRQLETLEKMFEVINTMAATGRNLIVPKNE